MKAANEFIGDLAEKISMPEVYQKIKKLMENPNATIDDYESAVQSDSMLAIRIIRIANSEFFGFNRKVDTLYDAIALIGVIQLHDLLLVCLCMRTFYGIPEQLFNFGDFWRHGIKCGIVSRRIAKLCRLPASNRFFTLGLLHEIGHAAMFIKNPELTLQTLMESRERNLSVDSVEREYFGFDYCQLGSALTRHWQLPEVYPQIVEYHLHPQQSNPVFRTEAEIINHAYHYCGKATGIAHYSDQKLSNYLKAEDDRVDFEKSLAIEVDVNIENIFAMLSPPHTQDVSISGMEFKS